MKKSVNILFFCCIQLVSIAQNTNNQTKNSFNQAIYGGITLTTNGWGFNIQYARALSNRYKALYGLNISNIRNEKEQKAFYAIFQNIKPYYYGKLNSLLSIRPFYGGKILMFEKAREKGVEIDFVWGAGLSLGLLNPVYLKIIKIDPVTGGQNIVEERYDPKIHQKNDILSKCSWFRGLNQSKLQMGLYAKLGFYFDISTRKQFLWGLEIGAQIDAFFSPVPMMYQSKFKKYYPGLYLNIMLGKKF